MWKASGKAVSMESVDGSISMAAMGSSDSRRGKNSLKFQKQESNTHSAFYIRTSNSSYTINRIVPKIILKEIRKSYKNKKL